MSLAIVFYSDLPVGYHNSEVEERLARLEARGHDVLLVEPVGIRNPRLRHLARLVRRAVGRDGASRRTGLARLSLRLLPPRRVPPVDALNRRWLARQILGRVEPSASALWLRFPTPELVPLAESAAWRRVVYELADEHELSPGITPRLRRVLRTAERRLLDRADVALASSQPVYERLAALHPDVRRIPAAAVDLERFARLAAEPPSQRQVALYLGAIDFRVDTGLLVEVARLLPGWTLVVAGPSLDGAGEPLREQPNIRLVGSVPRKQVLDLLSSASVCLMPYRVTPFTDTLFPVKAIEYLAAGRPVVSTPIRAARELERVTVAGDADTFAEAVGRALAEDSLPARLARLDAARPHSWDVRIEQLEAVLRERS